MNDSDKYAHKKTRDASILKHPEFSISFIFMPYRYLYYTNDTTYHKQKKAPDKE